MRGRPRTGRDEGRTKAAPLKGGQRVQHQRVDKGYSTDASYKEQNKGYSTKGSVLKGKGTK